MFIKQMKTIKIQIVFLLEKKLKNSFGTNMIAIYMGFITTAITDGVWKAL